MAKLSFSTSGKEEMDDFSVVPVAKYEAQIVKSDVKETKLKDGHRLNLQFKIINGEFKGRIIFVGLNIDNPNPIAVEISEKELVSICKACGKVDIEDSGELHNIPLVIDVKIKPAKGNYPEQNYVSKYEPYGTTTDSNISDSKTSDSSDSKDEELPWEDD